jgi:hypothetical protein
MEEGYLQDEEEKDVPMDDALEEEDQSPPIIIDGRYQVLKRFGDETCLRKMVFLVKDIEDPTKRAVAKVYTLGESEDFSHEVENNLALTDSPHVVKMSHFVGAHEDMSPMVYLGRTLNEYSCIILPFCQNGTLLDLLMNVVAAQA